MLHVVLICLPYMLNSQNSCGIEGMYYSQECSPKEADGPSVGIQSQLVSCSLPSEGYYTDKICITGNISYSGSNTGFAPCTKPSMRQYVSKACVAGDANTIGSDAIISTCPSGYFCL